MNKLSKKFLFMLSESLFIMNTEQARQSFFGNVASFW